MNKDLVSDVKVLPDRELFVLNAMRDLKLSQFRALGLLNAHPTLDRAAHEGDERYNSLKAQLHALDRWFSKTLSVDLVSRRADKRYELTPQGRAVAAHVARFEETLRDMIDASGSPEVRVNVPCTSDCLDHFVAVRDAMAAGEDGDGLSRMEVAFYAVASADFAPFSPERVVTPVLSFGSLYSRGVRLDLPPDVDQLILDEQPIVAISNDPDVDWPAEASVKELLKLRPRILMPTGGVVWRFMDDFAGSKQWRLDHGTHMPVHDLHFGLRALSTQAEPRAVMLVHGIQHDLGKGDKRYPPLENLSVIRLTDSYAGGPRAVTGLFHSPQAKARRVDKFAQACDRFWAAAHTTLDVRAHIAGEIPRP